MSRAHPQPTPAPAVPAPWRALSALLALLVLGAHLLAYAPAVHARLHACPDSETAHPSAPGKAAHSPDVASVDACAIALLAQGVTAAPTTLALSAPRFFATPANLVAATTARSAPPARLLPPAQAPPAAI
jgi:hypothetical protein